MAPENLFFIWGILRLLKRKRRRRMCWMAVSYTHLDVYKRQVLDGESMRDTVYNMITEYVENITDRFASPEAAAEDWDVKGLELNLHLSLIHIWISKPC